jgi:hypothetical protein
MLGQVYALADVKSPVVRALRLTAPGDITLALSRIDLWHPELCALADWPVLRKTSMGVSPVAGIVSLANGLGVTGVSLASSKEPFWYVDTSDLSAGDLAGRRVWTTADLVTGKATVAVWKWDATALKHVAETAAVDVYWWVSPTTLANDADKLALPGTRALLARSVCDLIGLMDRKEMDAAPWRQEYEAGLAEIKALVPRAAQRRTLRTKGGRVLHCAPDLL